MDFFPNQCFRGYLAQVGPQLEHCLGAWTSWWGPCQYVPSPLNVVVDPNYKLYDAHEDQNQIERKQDSASQEPDPL
eukprot:3491598-Amphidinium_carterae.1